MGTASKRPALPGILRTAWIAPAAVLVLAACASQGPQRSEAMVRDKCHALHRDARLDPLRPHMPVPIVLGEALPIEQLADRGRVASDAERDALKALEGVRAECRRMAEEALGQLPRYRYDSEDRISESLADLYAGGITWGRFNKTLLYIGESERAARETLEGELRAHEKWKAFHDFSGN